MVRRQWIRATMAVLALAVPQLGMCQTQVTDPPLCTADNSTNGCHGWSSWGTRTPVGISQFSCQTTVPAIPRAFEADSSWPTLYLYCNVVADGHAAGVALETQFGQLVPQLMIGNVEVCHGKNHSAQGPGTHRDAKTWLAQAQYYFRDMWTNEPKCVGGSVVSVTPGQAIGMSVKFGEAGAILTIGVTGSATVRSAVTISTPQLNNDLSWKPYLVKEYLRPYVAFEAWDAPSKNATKYPSGVWGVSVDSNGTAYDAWKPFSTGMNVETSGLNSANWQFGESL
eukprot:m.109415 g.109415  ORF g.109415 m.109415 type:complete len:282 (-) comp12847_c0_seq1:1403-2248(-)